MVQILDVIKKQDGIVVKFLSNGITINEKDKNADNHTPTEIVETVYQLLRDSITQECIRLGINDIDHKLPSVIDEVVRIELLGVNNINFTEGQQKIEQQLRCTGHTKFGKVIDLRNDAIFSLEDIINGFNIENNVLSIQPIENCTNKITVLYNGMTDEKSFSVTYTTLAEIEEQNRIAQQKAEEERIARLENLRTQKIVELQNACNKDVLSGFTCHVKDEDRFFGFELDDQLNLTGKLTILNADPSIESVFWKCKGLEGRLDTYTREEFKTICDSADNTKTKKIARFWTLKQSALSATTEEEIQNINW